MPADEPRGQPPAYNRHFAEIQDSILGDAPATKLMLRWAEDHQDDNPGSWFSGVLKDFLEEWRIIPRSPPA
jgi:hypothetical protein